MVSLAPAFCLALNLGSPFELTLLHTNDMHSHVEPVMIRGKSYGGYARQATLIQGFRKSEKNLLLLNGGDTFQGTLYFNVYEGLADLAFMNHVRFDAMAVGNHEFDRGPKVLGEFVKRAQFPVLAANLDVSADPNLQSLIKPQCILTVGKERIGVIGAVTPDLPTISNLGQKCKMLELRGALRSSLAQLAGAKVNKVFLVSHLGYDLEQQIAAEFPDIDVIVGGHSHSFLCQAGFQAPDGWPKPEGPYPTVIQHGDKSRTLLVQGWEWGKLLGKIRIRFDGAGRVVGWRDAAPIIVDDSIPEDPTMANLVAALQRPIIEAMSQKIAESQVNLDRSTLMREIIPDAMLRAVQNQGIVAAFCNVGGVRSGIDAGSITLGKLNEVQPFRNQIVILELTGQQLIDAIDSTVRDGNTTGGLLLPSEGTSYTLDLKAPAGSRVSQLVIAGKPVDLKAAYRLAFPNFTANGGDSHTILREAKGYRYDTGIVDIDALVEYMKSQSPINRTYQARVKTVGR